MKYWPIIDNSDSEVLVLVYTKDPPIQRKHGLASTINILERSPNVDVNPKLGRVSVMNLQDLNVEEVSRVELSTTIRSAFGHTQDIFL